VGEEYREKLKSLGFGTHRGQTHQRVITDERDGSVAGVLTEHWDDRVDAAARPKSIHVKAPQLVVEED
jgi:hypothetical protein